MLHLQKHLMLQKLQALPKICKVLLALSLSNCATHQGKPLSSLCILDFKDKMCWVDKSHGEGYSFKELAESEISYFGLNQFDLERIHATLNK